MPLPDGPNTPWPPKELAPAIEKLTTWSAWYSGDPDELTRAYQAIGNHSTPYPHVRPSQMRGGLVGTLARWFWGQPIPTGEKRTKLHVPLAGDIAATSADLLFSEPLTLTAKDTKDTRTTDKLEELMDDTLHTQLLEAAELGASLGGVYLRAVWDKEVNPDGPWISAMHADAGVPEWSYGMLRAVTFWQQLADDGHQVVRHLERHEPGVILHAIYEGTAAQLGRRVPLSQYPDTAALADVVTDGDRVETGIDKLTAVYVPNMRPNRLWRNSPACCHIGRSDYAGSEPFLDALDEVYSSWMRDVRQAKGRVFVPDVYLESRGPGRGAYFDEDREVYQSLNTLPQTGGSMEIELHQFDIRCDQHEKTALALVQKIISAAGYSGQTFGLAGDVAITATEVAARERKSLITRDKKIKYWRPPLADMIEVLLQLGATHFGWSVTPDRPTIDWPDAVQQDQASLATSLQQLEAARAVSIETKVRMLHPDWEDDDVDEEVQRIKDESGAGPVEDPGTFTGSPGDQPPPAGGKPADAPADGKSPADPSK